MLPKKLLDAYKLHRRKLCYHAKIRQARILLGEGKADLSQVASTKLSSKLSKLRQALCLLAEVVFGKSARFCARFLG